MLKLLIKLSLAVIIVLTGLFLTHISDAESPQLTPEDKYEIALDEWMYKLATCESGNREWVINPHDGGSPSYGLFQWKSQSFLLYNKKFNVFPDLTEDTVVDFMLDSEKAILMTKTVVSKEKNGYKNWYNCTVGQSVNKVGLPPNGI